MKRLIYFFIFILSLTNCKQEVEKPADLISRDQMKTVLKEMYIYRNLNEGDSSNNSFKDIDELNLSILEKNGISYSQFEDSFKFYIVNDAAYDELLLEIKEELQNSEYIPKKDSIVGGDNL